VAEARREDLLLAARAHRPAGLDDVRFRAVLPSRRGPAGSGQAPVVPAPAPPADDAPPPPAPAQGDAADALRLVERAQAGDADAFGQLYDRYVDVVFRYISYRVASRQLAEDLTSETFLRALRRIGSFTWQGRDVGAWFVTIARNLVADHYKSSRYRLELTTEDMTTVSHAGGGRLVEDSPEGEVLEQMQNQVLLEAVRQLNAEQQECIALRFLQGLSVAETAAVMGKNEGAIKALQYRAVRSLGRLLPEGLEL
jgi:RNA polymerase sigma-70 factor (ECF subfamily)